MTEPHTILIVDDEEQVGKALGRLMKQLGLNYVYQSSGKAGLEQIQKASTPFSLIISDQRMPGMEGSEFLEKARELSPNTLRFLLTGYADVDAVTRAVNKGAIHRYIAKPWNTPALIEILKAGLAQYDLLLEKDKLFKLAKIQNAKLFSLTTDLKKSSLAHQKDISHLDKEIHQLKNRLETGQENRNYLQEIHVFLMETNYLENEKINTLYGAMVSGLFEQFKEIAAKKRFEMPGAISGE